MATTVVIGLLLFSNACWIAALALVAVKQQRMAGEHDRIRTLVQDVTQQAGDVSLITARRQAEVIALRSVLEQIGIVVELDWLSGTTGPEARLNVTVTSADQPATVN